MKKKSKFFLNTLLIEISGWIVWKPVCETVTTFLSWCLSKVQVPDIEYSKEPLFELRDSLFGPVCNYTRLSWEVHDVIVESLLDAKSNLIGKIVISIVVLSAFSRFSNVALRKVLKKSTYVSSAFVFDIDQRLAQNKFYQVWRF